MDLRHVRAFRYRFPRFLLRPECHPNPNHPEHLERPKHQYMDYLETSLPH